jgi:hypothetical protein
VELFGEGNMVKTNTDIDLPVILPVRYLLSRTKTLVEEADTLEQRGGTNRNQFLFNDAKWYFNLCGSL